MVSKEFTDVVFDQALLRSELDQFHNLLRSESVIGERELQSLFKASHQITSFLGTNASNIGVAKQIAYEFEILGDYRADLVFGNPQKQYCLVELESGSPDAVLERVGKKATKEWSKVFEHGFSQIVDWFCHLDDFKKTARFHRNFGYGHIDFVGMLLIGRNDGLDTDDKRRLRWRTQKVLVDSQPVICLTYDDLYEGLNVSYERFALSFQGESSPTATPPKNGDDMGKDSSKP